MPPNCFIKCLHSCKSKLNKNKNKRIVNDCDIQNLKAKGRSVYKGPHRNSNLLAIYNADPLHNKQKDKSKKTQQKTNKSQGRKFDYKDQFRCLFCGGKKCPYENYLTNPQYAIKGLNCDLIDGNIYVGQRPCGFLIKKFNLIKTFISKNIGLIVNLQKQGEHPYCGPGEIDPLSGFTYRPSMFTSEGIRVKLAGWRESNAVDAMDVLLDTVKEIVYTITIEKKAVYIHCHSGNSRSGIVVACYKMFYDKSKAEEAVELIQYYRKELVKKKTHFKYVLKFQDYLLSKREIFTLDKLDINTFLKNQWDLEIIEMKNNISYIPKIIYKCLTKLLSMKFSKSRPYSNDVIYKAMNGSLEIIDDTYVQIKNLMIRLNDGYWDAIEHCDSTVIISEILFLWMDESVKACINPKRISKIIKNDIFKCNIESVLNENIANMEIMSNIYELCKKILRKSEFEILKFFAFFCNKLYPPIQPSASQSASTNNILRAGSKTKLKKSNAVLGSSFCSLSNINANKDELEEYNQMVEKISIYIVGFNIDMLFNEEINISIPQPTTHNTNHNTSNNNGNVSLCDATIFSTSGQNILAHSHGIHHDDNGKGLYYISQNTIKLIEFFRIYFSIVNNKENIPIDDDLYRICTGAGNNIIIHNHIENTTNITNILSNRDSKAITSKSPRDNTLNQTNENPSMNEDESMANTFGRNYSYYSSSEGEGTEQEEEEEEEEVVEPKKEATPKRKKMLLKQTAIKPTISDFFNQAHLTGKFNLKNSKEQREIPSEINFFTKKRNTTGLGLGNIRGIGRLKGKKRTFNNNHINSTNNESDYNDNNKTAGKSSYNDEMKNTFVLNANKSGRWLKTNMFGKNSGMSGNESSNSNSKSKNKKDDFILNKLNHQTNILRFTPNILNK